MFHFSHNSCLGSIWQGDVTCKVTWPCQYQTVVLVLAQPSECIKNLLCCAVQIPRSGFLTSGVYSLLTSSQGTVDQGHHEHPATKHKAYKAMSKEVFTTSGLKMQSAYAAGNEGREPPLTTQTDFFMGCLDYIWLSQSHWHVTHTLSMPYDVDKGPEPQSVGFRPIPDAEFPSDHLAMGCRVALL